MSPSPASIVSVDLGGDQEWVSFDIPGGSSPVSLARVYADPDTRALTALVRFPAGWERVEQGSYEVTEEFHVLEGAIEMNGERYEAGTWVRVPAGALRRRTTVGDGALTLARFDGPPRWNAGTGS